ncbi:MAG: hypothetical protein ACYCV7_08855, partial [Acidimicrobiales bacterium]
MSHGVLGTADDSQLVVRRRATWPVKRGSEPPDGRRPGTGDRGHPHLVGRAGPNALLGCPYRSVAEGSHDVRHGLDLDGDIWEDVQVANVVLTPRPELPASVGQHEVGCELAQYRYRFSLTP